MLRRDTDFLLQPYRLIVLNLPELSTRYSELQASRQLHDLPTEVPDILLRALVAQFGATLTRPATLGTHATTVRDGVAGHLTASLGQEAAQELAGWLVSEPAPLVTLARHLTRETIIGVYPTGPNAFLVRLRTGMAGLAVSHVVTQYLRTAEGTPADALRIFLDRRIRGAGGEDKGKGKGKQKGKAKGKPNAPAKGKGKGRKGHAKGKGKDGKDKQGPRPDRERSWGRERQERRDAPPDADANMNEADGVRAALDAARAAAGEAAGARP